MLQRAYLSLAVHLRYVVGASCVLALLNVPNCIRCHPWRWGVRLITLNGVLGGVCAWHWPRIASSISFGSFMAGWACFAVFANVLYLRTVSWVSFRRDWTIGVRWAQRVEEDYKNLLTTRSNMRTTNMPAKGPIEAGPAEKSEETISDNQDGTADP